MNLNVGLVEGVGRWWWSDRGEWHGGPWARPPPWQSPWWPGPWGAGASRGIQRPRQGDVIRQGTEIHEWVWRGACQIVWSMSSTIPSTVSQRNSFPDKTIWAHLRLFYPSSHVNQSMSWCNDGFLLDQGLRPTWAAIIRWQIVDQGRVTGEGSEREMGFINSEPSLQEFMPHQLDSADNTPPPTGIKIIKTNK